MARICGTCSIAHQICCIGAVEDALKVTPSDQTRDLRDLLLYGLNIRDHAMHLYLFCLPDLFGKDSILDFADTGYEHDLVHKAFDIKSAGNALSTLIGGRAVHSPFPQVGGFMKTPKREDLRALGKTLAKVRDDALGFADIFLEKDESFVSIAESVALQNERFSYLEGYLSSSKGICVSRSCFRDHLDKFVIPYSEAPAFRFEGKPYRVGALARVNLNKADLDRSTRKDLKKHLRGFPSEDTFRNNLAQAIEVVHCIDSAVEILDRLEVREEPKARIEAVKSEGTYAIEAPRGTLYYKLGIDGSGKISKADLVIPTSQNQLKMNLDIAEYVQMLIEEGKGKEDISRQVERLIRAYDPCMSCATHFLRINWKGERPSGSSSP
jgi:coenzyme F420-reducing hydrogenase alpha subunit